MVDHRESISVLDGLRTHRGALSGGSNGVAREQCDFSGISHRYIVESGEVGLIALPPPARSNGSCSFPASRFPMWVALFGEGWVVFQGRGGSAARGRSLPAPRTLPSSGIRWRFPGLLDAGAGSFAQRTYPHFRHLLTRSSSPDAATQYGAFPLRLVFWIQPASPLDGGDPEPFVLIPFKSTSPRSDSWHRIGRNFACAYIRTYRWPASGWASRSRLLALSSASVALFQPYLAFGRYQVSLSH
jgi:hypothetical protein